MPFVSLFIDKKESLRHILMLNLPIIVGKVVILQHFFENGNDIYMIERKRIVFVVNPISGTTGKKMVLRLLEKNIDKNRFDYDIVNTEYRGHATEIARSCASRGVDIVCAIGGDGTVNEIAKGLVHTNTALAIIPHGSGNGLARHLHIPLDPLLSINLINKCSARQMDYGKVNGIPFFCTCGVGFDAFISKKFADAGKRGPLTYIENVLNNGLSYNPETYELDVINTEDGKELREVHKAFLISCANASQYGNNAYIAPAASVRDGLMDVTIIEPFTTIEAAQIAIQLFNGNIEKNSRIKTFRCEKVVIHRSAEGVIHFDGDPVVTDANVEVEIIPSGLLCVCPEDEGFLQIGESLQMFFTEHFKNMYAKSEELIQDNIRRSQRITKINKEIIRKLAKR